jgi:hypothetical protein
MDLVVRPLRFTLTTRPLVVRGPDDTAAKRYALAAHSSQLVAESPEHDVLDPTWLDTFLGPDEVFFPLKRPLP